MIPGCTVPGFLDVVARLGASHPGITLHLSEGSASELQHGIRQRTLDVALTGYAGTLPADFAQHLVTDEQLHAFAPPGTELPKRPRLAQIQRHPVLCLAPGSGIRAAYDRSCAKLGLDARVDIEASSPLTLLGLAERGGDIAILPASTSTADSLVVTPISDATVHARLALIMPHERAAPAVRIVTDKLTAALAG